MSTPATDQQSRSTPTYEELYGFVHPPFALEPDPRFLYRSSSHDDAIAQLLQAIRRKEGFAVLTGETGMGKTTICRALMKELDPATFTSLILNPFVSIEELLRDVLVDFGIVSREAARGERLAAATRHELIAALHEFLLSLVAIKGSGILIIDEAQHLSPQVLEQVRIISTPETSETRLLQIVLAGQPSLGDMLADAGLRELDERISTRATLKPLTRDEVEAYIAHRLGVASGRVALQFEPEAVDAVHRHTGGVPRSINVLCDRTLISAAAGGVSRITAGHIDRSAHDMGLATTAAATPGRASKRRWLVAAAALLLVAPAAGTAFYLQSADSWLEAPAPAPPARPSLARNAPVQPKPIPTADFLLPPMPAAPRTADPSREVPDDQIGLRRPPG